MHYVNWIVQTTLIILALAAILMIFFDPAAIPWFFLAQASISFWQFIGALTVKKQTACYYQKINYLRFASLYLLLLAMSPVVFAFSHLTIHWACYILFITLPPWCLTFYYYSITWKITFRKRDNGRFLPHLSF
jgi:hypothetical protein